MLVRIEQYQLEQFSRFLNKLRSINESNSDARYLLDENLSIVSFLDSDFTIVNSVLAKHDYGGHDLVKLVVASELLDQGDSRHISRHARAA
ncbi:MAG: hypothetical protein ABGX07_18055 [Pirellulaceae bacterium]